MQAVVEVVVENMLQTMVLTEVQVVEVEELHLLLIHLEELELQVKEIMEEMVTGLVQVQQQVVEVEVLVELEQMLVTILVDKEVRAKVVA
jgi:hypothetical protein